MHQDVIDWLNEAFGIQATEILPGALDNAIACPITKTLEHHGVNIVGVNGDSITYTVEPNPLFLGEQTMDCPDYVRGFIFGFDAGEYPELIA